MFVFHIMEKIITKVTKTATKHASAHKKKKSFPRACLFTLDTEIYLNSSKCLKYDDSRSSMSQVSNHEAIAYQYLPKDVLKQTLEN